jgi:hypothetical protein
VEWIREGEISFPRTPGEPDSLRAWRPWVLEEADATHRMWYTGSDGTTSRILTAKRPPGGAWERLGVAIDAGFASESDSYGAESPCVGGPTGRSAACTWRRRRTPIAGTPSERSCSAAPRRRAGPTIPVRWAISASNHRLWSSLNDQWFLARYGGDPSFLATLDGRFPFSHPPEQSGPGCIRARPSNAPT